MSDHLSFPHCVPFLLPFWELLRCEKPLEEHWLQLWNSLAVCRPGRVLVGEQHTRWIARNSSGTLRRPWSSLRLAESRSGSVARPGAHNHKARAIAFAIGLHQSRHAKSAFAGRIKWVRGRRKEEQWNLPVESEGRREARYQFWFHTTIWSILWGAGPTFRRSSKVYLRYLRGIGANAWSDIAIRVYP